MIKAKCHSDDRCVEVNFDATPWFEQASNDDILGLIRCEWGYDYPSDEVAIFMADHNPKIKTMFDYIDIRGRIENIGFECIVDEATATLWLKSHRPDLLAKI